MRVISLKIIGFIAACGSLVGPWAQEATLYGEGLQLSVTNVASGAASQFEAITSSGYYGTGIWANASGSYTNTGVHGNAYLDQDYGANYGVRGEATHVGYGITSIGIYGTAYNPSYGSYAWAGYFDGDVYVSGYFDNPSDSAFKKDVQPLRNGLAGVLALKPSTYEMRTEEFGDRVKLRQGRQYGLIAQDVEKVFPDLVRDSRLPAHSSKDSASAVRALRDTTTFKSIDYLALVPILVKAVQEQNAIVQEQAAQIEVLREKIDSEQDGF